MNSSAQPVGMAPSESLSNMRAVSRQRIGRIRLPPANTLYRMARWIEVGGTLSAGRRFSRAASTAARSVSNHSGGFMSLYAAEMDWEAKARGKNWDHSSSASNGSAAIFPSAFFRRISTRPSASSSCFWHSRESFTPSSKSFIASSSERSALSSLFTTSSSRASDFSNSPRRGGSGGLFVTGLIPPRILAHDGEGQQWHCGDGNLAPQDTIAPAPKWMHNPRMALEFTTSYTKDAVEVFRYYKRL